MTRPSDAAAGAADVRLRSMHEEDVPAVLAMERLLFPADAWSEALIRTELAGVPESKHYVVAELRSTGDGQDPAGAAGAFDLVGYAGLAVVEDEGDVQTIAVVPAFQGCGVGAALLHALLAEAGARGCARVLLEVRADNERAQRLYRGFGFHQVGRRRGYYQPAGVDALVMRIDRPFEEEGDTNA